MMIAGSTHFWFNGESIAVYGCGGIGLNMLQSVALVEVYPIIIVDQASAKVDIAR